LTVQEDICYSDATGLAARIRAKELSPVEVMEAHQERIEAVNPGLNAVATLADDALARAHEAEAAIMRGEVWGPLHGVPFTIKDVFDTAGLRTTRGSRLFHERVPSADATAVRRLKDAGGILIGKTNLPEFALRAETSNLLFGRCENPWQTGSTPGGSSGGEASAISAGLSPLGVGSDLGGSNRLPAHYCGIVGLKATHGRVPLTGHWPEMLARYMHVGPIARTVRDVALALSVLSGPDGLDPYAIPAPAPRFEALDGPLPPLRVGWFDEGPFAPVAAEVQATVAQAVSALEGLGCTLTPVSLAGWERDKPIDAAYDLLAGEGVHYLTPFVSGRRDELTPQIQGLLDLPTPTLRDHLAASARCEGYRRDMSRLFAEHDLMLCPTAPLLAHPHEADELYVDGQRVEVSHAAAATVPFGLTGNPAVSVPFGWSEEGLPIGVQLVGRDWDEPTLLHAASALEALHEPRRRRPPV
jgi:aspartyl-tRNA(Asn)/glutamyl-tRNA(Gln) amidotransferase subunit A